MSTLLDKVKRKCYITDTSNETNERLNDLIEDSQIKVKRMIGIPEDDDFDFNEAGEERDLFLNYCFYAWNDSTNEFKANYLDDIMSIRSKYEVDQYDSEEEIS